MSKTYHFIGIKGSGMSALASGSCCRACHRRRSAVAVAPDAAGDTNEPGQASAVIRAQAASG